MLEMLHSTDTYTYELRSDIVFEQKKKCEKRKKKKKRKVEEEKEMEIKRTLGEQVERLNARYFMVLTASKKTEHILFLLLRQRSIRMSLSEFQS